MAARILLALLGVTLVAALPAAALNGPRLALAGRAPLTLRGISFEPAERVTLTVTLGRTVRRQVVASATGSFVVRFPSLVYDRCHGALKASAFGERGRRAAFTLTPLECPAGAGGERKD